MRCNDWKIPDVIKPIISDGEPAPLHISSQNLPQKTRQLGEMTEVCKDLDRLVVLSAELTNKYEYSNVFAESAGHQNGGVNSHELHVDRIKDHLSRANIRELHLVDGRNVLRASFWN